MTTIDIQGRKAAAETQDRLSKHAAALERSQREIVTTLATLGSDMRRMERELGAHLEEIKDALATRKDTFDAELDRRMAVIAEGTKQKIDDEFGQRLKAIEAGLDKVKTEILFDSRQAFEGVARDMRSASDKLAALAKVGADSKNGELLTTVILSSSPAGSADGDGC